MRESTAPRTFKPDPSVEILAYSRRAMDLSIMYMIRLGYNVAGDVIERKELNGNKLEFAMRMRLAHRSMGDYRGSRS
jgi:hypothetical protein